MSWSSLPDELVRVILDKLSLIQLASITTTCSSFCAFYWEKMARQQEARHKLAVDSFGSKRIACLCALIVRVLKKEPLIPPSIQYAWNGAFISVDGVLQLDTSSGPIWLRRFSLHQPMPEDIRIKVQPHLMPFHCCVKVLADSGAYWLIIHAHHLLKRVLIEVRDDENLKPVALMQALLSEGLARSIVDAGFQAEIRVGRSGVQIGPLMPFASRYIPAKTTRWEFVREAMLIGAAAKDWRNVSLGYWTYVCQQGA